MKDVLLNFDEESKKTIKDLIQSDRKFKKLISKLEDSKNYLNNNNKKIAITQQ